MALLRLKKQRPAPVASTELADFSGFEADSFSNVDRAVQPGSAAASIPHQPPSAPETTQTQQQSQTRTQTASSAWLLFKSGPKSGQSIPLVQSVTTIGRDETNDVIVADPYVSRRHATIAISGDGYRLENVPGAPIAVDGEETEGQMLRSGAEITIGQSQLVFMEGQDTQTTSDNEESGMPEEQPDEAAPVAGPDAAFDPDKTVLVRSTPQDLVGWLAISSGPNQGVTAQIRSGETVIGRDVGCNLDTADPQVSRRHLLIKGGPEGMRVFDLASQTGTWVGDRHVRGVAVRDTDIVTMGRTQIMIVEVEYDSDPVGPADPLDATMVQGLPAPKPAGVAVVRNGPDAGRSFTLVDGDSTIGRDDCDIKLSDKSVSRIHGVLRKTETGYEVFDFGSLSGTLVNGTPVTGVEISGGDLIKMGSSRIMVMEPGPEASTPPGAETPPAHPDPSAMTDQSRQVNSAQSEPPSQPQ